MVLHPWQSGEVVTCLAHNQEIGGASPPSAIMNNNIKNLLETAYNELGYFEKASNDKLDDKTENAGDLNYTKYARDCFPELQGLAWCCMFTWWCFEKTFGKIMARNLIGEKTAKCSIMKQRMIDNGCERVSNAKGGDLVFFDRGNGISHIGIVYSTGDTSFSTIEGNTSQSRSSKDYNKVVPNGGGVFVRAYNYGNPQINDFVRPKWDLIKGSTKEEVEPIVVPSSTGTYNAIINATNVNIREGAGTYNKFVGNETKGYKLYIIGEKNDASGRKWYRFIYKGKVAYICGDYVKMI